MTATTSTPGRYSIALQPICNASFTHVADELLYRAQAEATHAQIEDPLRETARACAMAFYEVGLHALVGSRLLFFSATREWIDDPDIMPLPKTQLVARVPPALLHEANAEAKLRELHRLGYRFAIDDQTLASWGEGALDAASFLKVDMRRPEALSLPHRYGREGLSLLAAFVEDRETLEQARQAGFDLFQGYVFSPPNQVKAPDGKPTSNRVAEMQLIAELATQQPSMARLENLLAQHPHLTLLILKQLNSAAYGQRREINSLREAILMLGMDRIRSMAAALCLSRNDAIQKVQLREVVIRAATCRNLARRLRNVDDAAAFTLGLLSRLDAMEGRPMAAILEGMPISEQLRSALLLRQGDLGQLLVVVERFEAGLYLGKSDRLVSMLNEAYVKAVAWAESLMEGQLE